MIGHRISMRAESVCERNIALYQSLDRHILVDARTHFVDPAQLLGGSKCLCGRPPYQDDGIGDFPQLIAATVYKHEFHTRKICPQLVDKLIGSSSFLHRDNDFQGCFLLNSCSLWAVRMSVAPADR